MGTQAGLLSQVATVGASGRTRRRRDTLLDFFEDVYTSSAECLVYFDGYRTRRYSYDQVRRAAYTFAARLRDERISKGEKVLLWGENRPEWLVALWGCILEGVVVVPVDYRSSSDLMRRIADIVRPRAIIVGDEVTLEFKPEAEVWRMAALDWSRRSLIATSWRTSSRSSGK